MKKIVISLLISICQLFATLKQDTIVIKLNNHHVYHNPKEIASDPKNNCLKISTEEEHLSNQEITTYDLKEIENQSKQLGYSCIEAFGSPTLPLIKQLSELGFTNRLIGTKYHSDKFVVLHKDFK
jgi:hypothetical protein